MFELQEFETFSVQRLGEVSRQSVPIQEKYIDRLSIMKKSKQQMFELFGCINTLVNDEQLNFKTKILGIAKIRSIQLNMDQVIQVLPLEERKYLLERQKYFFSIQLQNWKLKTEFIKITIIILGTIVTACGIYAYVFQAPLIAVPERGTIKQGQVNQRLQGVGAMLVGLSIIFILAIIFTAYFQIKKKRVIKLI